MSYTITRTNGTTLGTIADGTYDNSHTSLTLVGRNYSNYGQIMTNNLVRMIENSSYNISPSNPLSGQLWWDTGNSLLKVYTGSIWKIVSSCTSQSTAPSTTIAGDLWWDSINQQLYVYNGTSPFSAAGWILAGPGYPAGHVTGAIVEVVTDSLAATHYVTSLYADGTRVAIISKDPAFVPSPSISGFTTIQTGMNLAAGEILWGTANNASYLGNQPAANYLRTDIDNTALGSLIIQNDNGLTVGASGNLTVKTSSSGNVNITNTKLGGNFNFYANVSGTNTKVFSLDGVTGTASLLSATLSGSLTLGAGATVNGALNVIGIGSYSGNLSAPTQPAGTADTTVATTAFVVNNSGLYPYKIYNGASWMWMGSGVANLSIAGRSSPIFAADVNGVTFYAGATAITQPLVQGNIHSGGSTVTGNSAIATTSYVRNAAEYWGGSAKFVSIAAPDPTVGTAGDFWFQIAS